MNWEMWGAVLALATLIATLGLAILAQGRATRRGNQDALKSLGKDVNNRFEGMKAVLDQMDAKNEHAHAAITTRVDGVTARVDGVTTQVENLAGRVDRLTAKVDVVAHDVAFLAGRRRTLPPPPRPTWGRSSTSSATAAGTRWRSRSRWRVERWKAWLS